jgi:hypothetical protein
MKSWLVQQALGVVLPVVVGYVTPVIMAALKAMSARLNGLPAEVQRAVVLVIAGAGTAITSFLGVQVTGDPTLWTNADVNTLVAAALAYAFHAAQKAKQAAGRR